MEARGVLHHFIGAKQQNQSALSSKARYHIQWLLGYPSSIFFLPAFSRSALVIQRHRTSGGSRNSCRSDLRVENGLDKERLVLSFSPVLCPCWVLGVRDPRKVQLANERTC